MTVVEFRSWWAREARWVPVPVASNCRRHPVGTGNLARCNGPVIRDTPSLGTSASFSAYLALSPIHRQHLFPATTPASPNPPPSVPADAEINLSHAGNPELSKILSSSETRNQSFIVFFRNRAFICWESRAIEDPVFFRNQAFINFAENSELSKILSSSEIKN